MVSLAEIFTGLPPDCDFFSRVSREVDPWWDVHALLSFGPGWKRFLPLQIDGRAPLDVDGMTSRVEEVLERTLRRS